MRKLRPNASYIENTYINFQEAYKKKSGDKEDTSFIIFVIFFLIETVIINTFHINDDLQAKY